MTTARALTSRPRARGGGPAQDRNGLYLYRSPPRPQGWSPAFRRAGARSRLLGFHQSTADNWDRERGGFGAEYTADISRRRPPPGPPP